MSSASDLSCHHQSGCFALADDQTGGLLSKICHHHSLLQLPQCLFPRSASCKHFISDLRHPTLSAPAFPEGAINPLAHRFTQKMVSIWVIQWYFWLLCGNASASWGSRRQLPPRVLAGARWGREQQWQHSASVMAAAL